MCLNEIKNPFVVNLLSRCVQYEMPDLGAKLNHGPAQQRYLRIKFRWPFVLLLSTCRSKRACALEMCCCSMDI